MAVDLSRSLRPLLEGAIDRATGNEAGRRWQNAADAWDEAARLAKQLATQAQSPGERARREKTAEEFTGRAARCRQSLGSGNGLVGPSVPATERPNGEIASGSEEEREHQAAVQALRHRSTVGWDEIAGLADTKRAIQSAYALSLAQAPAGVKLSPVRNILFYGPPGCGKSLLAAATSRGLEATFFNVKVSDLLSKYFGESSKLVSALFTEARREAPSVVFLDEVDALTGSRDGSDNGAERRLLANLLAELDGVSEKGDRRFVLTIAATNTPWAIDPAILSRFERKVFIPLPDHATREQIIRLQLADRGYSLTIPAAELAQLTEGFSGRELERLTKLLVERMIANANPDLTRIAMQGRAAVESYHLLVRPITRHDIDAVLQTTHPETPKPLLERFREFATRQD